MFADVVMGVERHYFEEILDKCKKKAQGKKRYGTDSCPVKKIVEEFKAIL